MCSGVRGGGLQLSGRLKVLARQAGYSSCRLEGVVVHHDIVRADMHGVVDWELCKSQLQVIQCGEYCWAVQVST